MPRTPLTLPTEVCERVLDHLKGRLGRGTLYNCCLVCRDWVPRSRLHLYISVELDPGNFAAFVRGISLQPFNGHLARVLQLSSGRDQDHHKLSLVPLQHPQLLPNLRHIKFFAIGLIYLHPTFFTYLSRFRSVRTLTLGPWMSYSTIIQLARYLTAFSGLNRCGVYLGEGNVRSLSFPGTRLPTKRIAVSNLALFLSPDLLQVAGPILDIFSPSSIHSLRMVLEIPQSDWEGVRQLIASFVIGCVDSLCVLFLGYSGWEHLDFSHNTRLVSLSLTMERYFVSVEQRLVNPVRPSTLSRILSTICSKCMKELCLGINISTSSMNTISRSGWDELDATLALSAFSQVERISIHVRAYFGLSSGPDLVSVSERTVRQLLPRLAARSVANLSLSGYELKHARDYKVSSPDDLGALDLQTENSGTSSAEDQDYLKLKWEGWEM